MNMLCMRIITGHAQRSFPPPTLHYGTEARRRNDESPVPVRAGEQLTERQALAALLLPSANNMAAMLARHVAGSVAAFVGEMNRAARAMRMTHTTYTDPSGLDDGTRSTAADQVILA